MKTFSVVCPRKGREDLSEQSPVGPSISRDGSTLKRGAEKQLSAPENTSEESKRALKIKLSAASESAR